MSKSITCTKCSYKTNVDKLEIKMGGLICPKCRVILFYPGLDKEYSAELKRRREL